MSPAPNDTPAGVEISIKVPGRPRAGADDFSGMCHGAGGCAWMSTVKSSLDAAGLIYDMDMDRQTGMRRRPGTAGAHPIMQPHYCMAAQLTDAPGGMRPSGSATCLSEKTGPVFQVVD